MKLQTTDYQRIHLASAKTEKVQNWIICAVLRQVISIATTQIFGRLIYEVSLGWPG